MTDPEPPAGRFYKSRKSRPCDLCRRRKVACEMPTGPPCTRCSTKKLSCTFEHGPGERKRREVRLSPAVDWPEDTTGGMYLSGSIGFQNGIDDMFCDLVLPDVEDASMGQIQADLPMQNNGAGLYSPHSDTVNSQASEMRAMDQQSLFMEAEPGHGESLELVPDAFSFYVGPTGAADVHLLQKEDYDTKDISRPKIRGLKYRRVGKSANGTSHSHSQPVIFGITDQNLLKKAEPRVEIEAAKAAWAELWKTIDEDTAWSLVKLYGRFVDPFFPIISSHQIPPRAEELSNMPLGLLSAICASALPFVVYDEHLYGLLLHPPSSQQLYRICWLDISQHLHSPTLATLQACLLLQQRLPTNPYLSDTAFSWSLLSTAVAIAQTIGLHRDPMGWSSVPLWERRLRKRLWWALWAMERWVSLIRGMPSHITDDECDVSPLTGDSIADCLSSSSHTSTHLCQLVDLTAILADIYQSYYTVRAVSVTAKNLELSLELARSLRARLKIWLDSSVSSLPCVPRQSTPPSRDAPDVSKTDLDGSSSLYLSYLVTHMTLFRALLRPLDQARGDPTWATESNPEGARAVIKGALLCVKDFLEFFERLRDAQWNAFWHSWSRPNFAIAGSFMVLLLHITSSSLCSHCQFREEDTELRHLVNRWRVANRVSANGAAGARGLANLGLLRVETFLGELMIPKGN